MGARGSGGASGSGRRRLRRRTRAALSASITLVVLPILINLVTNEPPASWQAHWWLFAVVGLLFGSWAVVDEVRRTKQRDSVDLSAVAEDLARSVRLQWEEEAGARRMNDPTPLRLHWTVMVGSPFPPWEDVVAQGLRCLPPDPPARRWATGAKQLNSTSCATVEEVFCRVPTRRLVVVGQPGAGKTMLLVDLVLELLKRRQAGPVPVLLSLASWNPLSQEFRQWLADRLATEHPMLAETDPSVDGELVRASALIQRGLVLPVLDGFDEIPAELQPSALERLRAVPQDMGFVISSRRLDFLDPGTATDPVPTLPAGVVGIELGELSIDAVRRYLDPHATGRWAGVFERLTGNGAIAQVLRTPLMVGLADAIYNGFAVPLPDRSGVRKPLHPSGLIHYDTDKDALRDHLFEAFLTAAYRGREAQGRRAERWLRSLARYLHERRDNETSRRGQPATDFGWWQLRDVVPQPLIGIVLGLPPAIAVGSVAAIYPHLGAGLGVGILAGVAVGAAVGAARGRFALGPIARRLAWVFDRLPSAIRRTAGRVATTGWIYVVGRPTEPGTRRGVWWIRPPDSSVGRGIAAGFLGGVIGAAASGVLLWSVGVLPNPAIGLMGALGAGIAAGAVNGSRRGFVGGIAGGVGVVLAASHGVGLVAGLVDGLATWIACALVIELNGLSVPARGVQRLPRVLRSPIAYQVSITTATAIGIAVALTKGQLAGLVVGLASGSFGGVAAALEGEPADLKVYEAAAGPRGLLARDRATFLLVGVTGGLAFGIGAGVGVQVAVGLAAGLTVGLVAASIQAVWMPFTVARLWFGLTGRFPWRLMTALDLAHQRGVLRQAGGMYQFRHVELQRRLAADPASSPSPPRNTPDGSGIPTRS